EARSAADQRAAGKYEPRHRLPAPFGNRAGAVREPLAAGKRVAHQRMRLEALKLLERREIRILIIQVENKTERSEIVFHVTKERTAAGSIVERPAEGVLHEARPVPFRRDLPELLEPDAELARVGVPVELEARNQRLGDATARALGDERVFRA